MIKSGLHRDAAASDAQAPARVPLLKLEDFLPHRLNVLSSLISQALSGVYDRYGIGIPEWRVLVTLGENGVMTGKAIGARTHMHKTKVSRAVAQLEQRRLLARRPNRADLRESFLTLTPAGRSVYEELAPSALDFMDRLFEMVAPADRPAFDRAMKELTRRSAELVAQGEPGKTRKLLKSLPLRR
jgi:DNA-binding MarR family transcriptional regulator